MSKLFEPITIRGMVLKNRIVMLPMRFGMDLSSPQARAFYAERARGGCGAMVTAATDVSLFVDAKKRGQSKSVLSDLGSLSQLAKEVHEASLGTLETRIGVQLLQLNNYGVGRGEWLAPSPRIEPTPSIHAAPPGAEMRQLTNEEIEHTIAGFAQAASGVRDAGFDFVEIHACHGSLPSQFLSPIDNRREDSYGGSLAGRMKFGIECVKGMRAAVGDDFPVFFRIGAADDRPGGLELTDSVPYAVELEKAGVDCFDVSTGISIHRPRFVTISPTARQPMGTYVHLAQAVRQAVKVPVIAAGRINTSEIAGGILEEGKADLTGLGRQLIADPMWPKKTMEGHLDEIILCDSCNRYCWRNSGYVKMSPGVPICHRNPQAGREWEAAA